ncbi:MAG: hypothetical protein ACKO3Q_05830, partial [Betaproteobacteria bacterium]
MKNQLQVSAPADKNYFNVELPIYAAIAGIDLVADPKTAPSVSISAKPFEGKLDVDAKNLEQLANFSKISVADLITALPNMLSYLQTIDVDQLGLSGLPFVEQSVGDLLDVASVFKTRVIDRINFDRPMKLWERGAGERASASGSVAPAPGASFAVLKDAASLTGVAGQFAASMSGYWITVEGANADGDDRSLVTQIIDVSADGTRVSLSNNFAQDLGSVSYTVHEKIEKIQTIDEFIAAVNASGLLGDRQVTYDAAIGDLRIPVQFAGSLLDLQTPINLGLGQDSPVALSTTATGIVGVDIDAGFDLILSLGGSKFSLAIDRLSATAGIELAVTDLTVAAQLGFFGLQSGGQGSGSGVRLEAEATLALDRTPNQAGGTRFEIAELLSSEALGSITVDVSGSAEARLRGLSVNAGSASMVLDKDLDLALYVPDLLDWRAVELRNSPFNLKQALADGSLPAGAVVVVLPDLGSLLDVR